MATPADDHGFELPPARPSFLNRLELDDDSGYHTPAAASQFDEFSHEPGELDPRLLSAGHALRAFEDPDEPSDFNSVGVFTPVPPLDPYAEPVGEQSYTLAGDISADDFDAPHGNYAANPGSGGFVPPDAFDQSDVISIRPATVQPKPAADGEDFPDLESALEALDVDLDDLGAAPTGGGQARRPARGPGGARSVRAGNASEVPTARGRNESILATSPTEDAGAHNARKRGQAATPTSKPASKPASKPTSPPPTPSGRTHKRANTEDGIEIDFDDDE